MGAEIPGRRIMKIAIFSRTDLGMEIQHRINAAGHLAVITEPTASQYNDLERVKRIVGKTDADAWIIGAGSKEVLQ